MANLSQRLMSITIDSNLFASQSVNDAELSKSCMSITASESTQRDEDPILSAEGAEYNSIFKPPVACSIVEILYGQLIHGNNHGTVLVAGLESTLVVFLLA